MNINENGGQEKPKPIGDVRKAVQVARKSLRRQSMNTRAFERRDSVEDSSSGEAKPGKIRRDVIARMLKNGSINRNQMTAAQEIEQVFQIVGRHHFAKSSWRQYVDEQRRVPDLLSKLSDRDTRLLHARVLPWLASLRKEPVVVTFRDRVLSYPIAGEVSLAVIVDNLGTGQADRYYRLRKGATQRIVATALQRYCELDRPQQRN